VLPPHVLREILKLRLDAIWAVGENSLDRFSYFLLCLSLE
jgi:hypothetical protein